MFRGVGILEGKTPLRIEGSVFVVDIEGPWEQGLASDRAENVRIDWFNDLPLRKFEGVDYDVDMVKRVQPDGRT